ncbi:MAG: outer membrane beta-barrel protein [Ferruginibacter sp.]
MRKIICAVILLTIVSEINPVSAQVLRRGVYDRRFGRVRLPPKQQATNTPSFEPTVNISVGYGFPNLDKYALPELYNYYKGSYSQTGPLTGSVDYQFSRTMSIGVLVTHGKVSVPYYAYNNNSSPALNGSLENWSFMLNLVRYIPVSGSKVAPYLRTAIGINSWQQNFTDDGGNKVNVAFNPQDLAYQVGLGAKFNLSKKAGLFVEAGYGKYILNGGLAVKF